MHELKQRTFLLGRHQHPVFKDILQFRRDLDHFTLRKELRQRDPEAPADGFQRNDRGFRVPAENVRKR